MSCEHPKYGEIWRHFKENQLYRIETVAEHTEMSEMLVVYQALARTEAMPACSPCL